MSSLALRHHILRRANTTRDFWDSPYVQGNWIPGRMLRGGWFYSRAAERRNINLQAKAARGRKKKQLQKQARTLQRRMQQEQPVCAWGPPAPTATATAAAGPTLEATATPAATPTATALPLRSASATVYYSEHSVFIIPDSSQVTWTGSNSWGSVYAPANIDSYVNTLKGIFPGDYFFVVVAAANLTPNTVPNVLTYRHLAHGIGEDGITGVGVPNICRYHIGSGQVIDGAFAVLDHEIGHNWGVFIGNEVGEGHWHANSTASGQMASVYIDDGYQSVKQITGNPDSGFTWTAVDNIVKNETEIFSDHDLYLQGFAATFPDLYVLQSPVYNPDRSVSHSGAARYDQAWVEARNGVRLPNYQTSEKRLRMGFVYVARDLAEVLAVYQPVERSINHYVNGEALDNRNYHFQVPFLVATKFRASVDARLADLDGNATPTLAVTGSSYLVSSSGSATLPFSAADPDGSPPSVSCVPEAAGCSISGSSALISGLARGSHFFTLKAQDSGGKKSFAHFVIDVP